MAQINLLKQKKADGMGWQTLSSIAVKLLVFGVLALVGWYGYLIFQGKQETRQALELEQQIEKKRSDVAKKPDRNELFTRQRQLKELQTLVQSHPYWSGLLPALADATLKNVDVLTFRALHDGTLSMGITVPNMVDLDKFLQVFDLPQFNANFYDIKIGAIGRTKVEDSLVTTVDIKMKYNPKLLEYQKNK